MFLELYGAGWPVYLWSDVNVQLVVSGVPRASFGHSRGAAQVEVQG